MFNNVVSSVNEDQMLAAKVKEKSNFTCSIDDLETENKLLTSVVGCQVHVHVLNQAQSLEKSSQHFVELYEMSGTISTDPFLLALYTHQRNFESLIVCFDFSNKRTI